MKEILAALAIAVQTLKSRADAALSGMGPIDQFQGAEEVSYALKTLGWISKEVEAMGASVAAVEAKFSPEVAAAAALLVDAQVTERIAAMIAAKEVIPAADLELATGAAEAKGRSEAEAAFKLKEDAALQIATRRTEITTAHGAAVAALLTDEVLGSEDFGVVTAELGRRITEMEKIGVTAAAKPTAFGQIACGIPFTDEGKTEFDTRLAGAKELAGPVRTPGQGAASQRPAKIPGSGPALVPGAKSEVTEKPAVSAAAF